GRSRCSPVAPPRAAQTEEERPLLAVVEEVDRRTNRRVDRWNAFSLALTLPAAYLEKLSSTTAGFRSLMIAEATFCQRSSPAEFTGAFGRTPISPSTSTASPDFAVPVAAMRNSMVSGSPAAGGRGLRLPLNSESSA